jgi:RHS repeat-associated protein
MARSGFAVSLSSLFPSSRNSFPILSHGARNLLLLFVLLCTTLGFTQTGGEGVQPTEATNGEVSLDTLNIHLDLPIVSKPGIGLPYTADITYNSNFWTLNAAGFAWVAPSLGTFWRYPSMQNAGFGFLNGIGVYCNSTQYLQYTGYQDRYGNYFGFSPIIITPTGGTVGSCVPTYSSKSFVLPQGNGITIALSYAGPNTVTFPDGTVEIIPQSAAGDSKVDVHGNTISETTCCSGLYVDTFGVTELTVAVNASPYYLTYTYPTSTGSATATLNFTSYTLETDFGCPGVGEFPATSGSYFPSSLSLPDGSSYSFTYESQVAGTITGRIASITYPSGEVVSYAYTGPNNGINCKDGSTAGLTRTVAGDAVYQYTRNTTTWLTTTLVNDYGTGHSNNTNVYTFSQQTKANGGNMFLTQAVFNQGTSTPLATKVYCYNGNQTSCPTATAPTLPLTQIDTYTTPAGMSTASRVSQAFDGYMNTTMSAVYDFGGTTATRQTVYSDYGYSWNGSTTSPTCTTPIGSGVKNKPCQIQLENGSGTQQFRNSYFEYGTTTSPGSLLKSAMLASSGTYLTTSATYNANGSVATVTDVNGNVTTLTQGTCNGGRTTKVVPAISTLDTQYTWDSGCNGAKLLSTTDSNGFSISATYNDPFWRPTSETDQLNNTVNLSYYPTVPINTTEAQMTFGSSDSDVFSTSDAMGRPLYAQQIESSGGSWDTVQMGYSWNTTGPVGTKTMPCAAAKGVGCSNGTSTITHDALGRTLVVTDGGGGTVTNTYTAYSSGCGQSLLGCVDILSVVGPAPAGEVVKQVQKEYNGLGQLMSVCRLSSATGTTSCGQAAGGTGYLTTYNYNADGTVFSILRGSQTHSFTYDALGRTLTSTYPESGTKQFFYDSAPSAPGVACSTTALPTGTGLNVSPLGHLVKMYDANGTTTCFSYDAMNRNTGIAYAGANWDGENKYFTYDSATVDSAAMTNALGRVAEAYTAPTATGTKVTDEGFSYTARGEVSDVYQWSTNSNGWYHTSATYFANHALNTLSGVPGNSGSPWSYVLDGKGRPYSASESSSNSMVSSTIYNAADEPCVITFNTGDTDTYLYDNNTTCSGLLSTSRMTTYTFSIGATPKTFAGGLTWNANGTLRGLATVDAINSGSETETCAYGTSTSAGYDELGRLLQVNCVNGSTNVWNQTFTYDIYNNVTKSVPTGGTGVSWIPGYSATNNQYALTGTSYDSNGNLLTDTFHTYTWNQDNHPKAMTDAGITLTYDAFGRMIEKATGSTYQQTLISPVGPVALMSKQNLTQYRMPLPGGAMDVSGIYFYHKDYLGSVPLVSSRGNRLSIAARLFAPYGESYNNVGITGDVNFTGDYQDLVAGTFDTPNRELNPTQGRWISPDPAHASWNAYSYSTNPLVETDPSGLSGFNGIYDPLNVAQNYGGAGGQGPLSSSGSLNQLFSSGVGGITDASIRNLSLNFGSDWISYQNQMFAVQSGQNSAAQQGLASYLWQIGATSNFVSGPAGPGGFGCDGPSCWYFASALVVAANNGPQQQPQQTPQQTKKQPWYCGTGNSWSHPFTAPTGRQWGQWAVADAAISYGFAKYLGPDNPVSDVFTVSSLVEGWGWATCD